MLRFAHATTRIALTLVLGVATAVAAPRDNIDPAPKYRKPADPAKHPGHHKPGEPHGKTPAADPKTAPPPPAAAQTPPAKPAAESTEPPPKIPRFAALKTDETNMRKGPGQRYPIEWVYRRRDLPVEVERDYDVWRLVRDPEGVQGWVHQVTLSERRTFIVKAQDAFIRADRRDNAAPVAQLKSGVIGRIRSCEDGSPWCQVQVTDQGNNKATFKGYIRRDQIWGLLPNEIVGDS